MWAYYDKYGWCRGEVIRWRKASNAHTLCFGRGTLAGGEDDVEDVVFDGDDDTLLWGVRFHSVPEALSSKQSLAGNCDSFGMVQKETLRYTRSGWCRKNH